MDQLAVWADLKYEPWIDPAKTVPKAPYAGYLARRAEALKSESEGEILRPYLAWEIPRKRP
jgi:hypothetical protein